MKPRELTDDEAREAFLEHVWHMIDYWEREDRQPASRGKLEGLAFSILTAIDGGTAIPPFALAPVPHPDDKAYNKANGEDWWPSAGRVRHDIAGGLHEHFHGVGERLKAKPDADRA